MPLNTLLIAQEIILNRFLQLDPETKGVLKQLCGKVVKIELNYLSYFWLLKSDAIYLTKDYTGVVDLILRGSLLDFMRLAFIKKDMAVTGIPIQVSGDMEFARQFKDLFANMDIDWEEQLSHLIGDTAAYPVACFLKNLSQWAKQSIENVSLNITDYLQSEKDLLVSKEELQIFFSDVDDLRDDLARLQVRIQRMPRKE
ncbi:MAG: SCP2 sterol-binding domain-containing protein [Rickettsiella sp.]|nr:SCP2 sterol-binding domain-containing protein [Rickettsiella sp.]